MTDDCTTRTRAAIASTPKDWGRADGYILIVLALFGTVWAWGTGLTGAGNPFISMTAPYAGGRTNLLQGYSIFVYSGKWLMNENLSYTQDQLMFGGLGQSTSFYALRFGGSFLAFLLFPGINGIASAQLLNTAMLVIALCSTYWACRSIGNDRWFSGVAAILVGTLSCFSFYLSDYSAHLPGAAMGATVVAVVVAIRPWNADRGRMLALVGVLLVFAVTTYYANLALALAFAASLLTKRRLLVSVPIVCIAVLTPRIYAALLNRAYGGDIDYFTVEAGYLRRSLAILLDTADQGMATLASRLLEIGAQTVFSEPLTVALLAAIAVAIAGRAITRSALDPLSRRSLAFLALTFCLSLGMTVFAGLSASARGYLSFLLPISAVFAFALLAANARLRALFLAVMMAACGWQLYWSMSVHVGNPYPPTHFFLGEADPVVAVERFLSRPVFLRQGTDVSAMTYPEMIADLDSMAAALDAARPEGVAVVRLATVPQDLTSRLPKAAMSSALPLILVTAVCLLGMTALRTSLHRRLLVSAVPLLLWLLSFGFGERKDLGDRLLTIQASLPPFTSFRHHAAIDLDELRKVLDGRKVEEVVVTSGTFALNSGQCSDRIASSGRDAERFADHPMRSPSRHNFLSGRLVNAAVADLDRKSLDLAIEERYSSPVSTYLGYPRVGPRGETALVPPLLVYLVVEGRDAPTILLYPEMNAVDPLPRQPQ